MKKSIVFVAALSMAAAAAAKLPAPSPEAQAKADETKAKTAWADKNAAYKLCLAQDRTAAYYLKSRPAAVAPVTGLPACADPGPYVAAQAATKVGVADSLPLNKEPVKK